MLSEVNHGQWEMLERGVILPSVNQGQWRESERDESAKTLANMVIQCAEADRLFSKTLAKHNMCTQINS